MGFCIGRLGLNAVNGEERAADALENPRLSCDLGECSGVGDAFVGRQLPAHQKLAEADCEDVEEPLRRKAGFGEIAIAVGKGAGGIEALAFGEPLEVAALAPESEVDLRNGGAIEL